MKDGLSFTIEGLPEAAAALDRLVANVHAAGEPAMADGAEALADEWRGRVPEGQTPADTHPGAYRAGITVQHEETSAGGSALVNVHGDAVHYAHRLEFGAVGVDALGRRMHTPPQPSARPAFDAAQARIQTAAAAKIKAAADKR